MTTRRTRLVYGILVNDRLPTGLFDEGGSSLSVWEVGFGGDLVVGFSVGHLDGQDVAEVSAGDIADAKASFKHAVWSMAEAGRRTLMAVGRPKLYLSHRKFRDE